MSDDNKKLLELEKEFRETVVSELARISKTQEDVQEELSDISKNLDLHTQKMGYELVLLRQMDDKQNILIDEHIAGVNTLKDLYELHEARLAKLEVPSQALNQIKTWATWLVAVAGGLAVLSRFMGWF